MFRKLENECKISFDLVAQGPVCIRSGESFELNPGEPDIAVLKSMWNGKMQPVIPGSSIKGVIRSRAEKYLEGSCTVFDKSCMEKSKDLKSGLERYKAVCPACKLFGCMSLKSRAEFKDAFPVEGTVFLGSRNQVAIDRLTGSARGGALFEPEVVEAGTFRTEIILRNFEPWQLKVILLVLDDINNGYVRIGSSASRGFGRMTAENIHIVYKNYKNPGESIGEFFTKEYSLEECLEKLKNASINSAKEVKFDGIPD